MSNDYRNDLVKSIERSLTTILDQDIQKLMGHSSISTTMRYITLTNEQVKAAYEQHIA